MAIEELVNEIESMKNIAKEDFLAKIKDQNNWEMNTTWSSKSFTLLQEVGRGNREAFSIDVFSDSLIVSLGSEIIFQDDLIYPTFFQRLCGKKPKKSELRELIDVMIKDINTNNQIKKLQDKRDTLKSLIKK